MRCSSAPAGSAWPQATTCRLVLLGWRHLRLYRAAYHRGGHTTTLWWLANWPSWLFGRHASPTCVRAQIPQPDRARRCWWRSPS
ncbi:hypothetical protein ACPA9J_28420 [Pseudomonas aeruginosa]